MESTRTSNEFSLRDTFTIIASQTVRIRTLERQNRQLRAQLPARPVRRTQHHVYEDERDAHLSEPDSSSAPPIGPEESSLNAGDQATLAAENATLLLRHMKLRATCDQLAKTAEQAVSKAKRYKQAAKQWDVYLRAKHPEIYQTAPAVHSSEVILSTNQLNENRSDRGESRASAQFGVTKDHAFPGSSSSEVDGHFFQTLGLSTPSKSKDDELPVEPGSGHNLVSSGATTVVETQSPPLINIKRESSSDNEPVFISARSLKRKRAHNNAPSIPYVKPEPKSSQSVVEIKSEEHSNAEELPPRLVHADTTDLDAVGKHLVTPRKMRRIDYSLDREPVPMDIQTSRPRPELETTANIEVSSTLLGQVRPSRISDSSSRSHERPRSGPASISHTPVTKRSNAPRRSALLPVSGNVPRLTAKTLNSTSKAKGLLDKIGMLSEGNEDISSGKKRASNHRTLNNHPPDPELAGRLEDVMNAPASERSPLSPRKSTIKPSSARGKQPFTHDSPRAMNTKSTPSLQTNKTVSPNALSPPPDDPPPVLPEHEPLRLRPLRTLRADDFKINPRYLGTDFAFADTLRGRDARRGLHICTRAACCGDALRRLVDLAGPDFSANAVSSTSTSRPMTDAAALTAYLGPDWASAVRAHGGGPAAAAELLAQARAFALAAQHGRHRRTFERQPSPPGFWRTDMPSTQELEEDRERARAMEHERVEEMWREALRDGGRWRFRDE